MGLDMFAYVIDDPLKDVDFNILDDAREIFYWRKHPNLHGWMEALYRIKGGQKQEFNCVGVKLDLSDLDRLTLAVNNDALPPTTGFFFGASQPEDKARDLEFIAIARAEIEQGNTVIYTSWW